jgi:ion channel-forming bestrophin family protein
MLNSARPAWRHLLPEVGWPLFGLFTYSIGVSLLIRGEYATAIVSLPDLPLSLMGAALGIFLGFRTNSAYDRWWEARTLWGQLVNQSRSLARQAIAFTETHPDRAGVEHWVRVLLHTHIAYVHSLRSHLRREDVLAAMRLHLSGEEVQSLRGTVNIPVSLLRRLGCLVAEGAREKYIDGFQWQRMDETLSALTDVQGGCERIKNTPLPRQYDLFPEFFTFVYCALLPLGLVGRMGLATAPLVVLIAFVFLATNRIGRNIENPFERLPNDIPMTALTVTIETDLRQALNEPVYPAPVQAEHGVLM